MDDLVNISMSKVANEIAAIAIHGKNNTWSRSKSYDTGSVSNQRNWKRSPCAEFQTVAERNFKVVEVDMAQQMYTLFSNQMLEQSHSC